MADVKRADRQQSPGDAVVAVTKSATVDLPNGTCRALCIGTAGTLNFIDASGNSISSFPAQAGYNPICVQRVLTGGTASDIWAIY